MLRPWMNLLPVFVLRRIAEQKGEVFRLAGTDYHLATNGVLFAKRPEPAIAARKENA